MPHADTHVGVRNDRQSLNYRGEKRDLLEEDGRTTLEAGTIKCDAKTRLGLGGKSRMALHRSKEQRTRSGNERIEARGAGKNILGIAGAV